MVEKVIKELAKYKKTINGANILVLGVAYRNDIDDCHESPALKIIDLLLKEKAEIRYHDAYVPEIKPHAPYAYEMNSVELTEEVIRSADCVLITTKHSHVDYERVAKHAAAIVDTRNACKHISDEWKYKVTKI